MCFYYSFSAHEKTYSTKLAEMIKLLADNRIKFTVARLSWGYRVLVNEGLIRDRSVEYAIRKMYAKHQDENLKEIQKIRAL